MFSGIEDQIKMILTKETLADCVVLVKKRVAQEKMIGNFIGCAPKYGPTFKKCEVTDKS